MTLRRLPFLDFRENWGNINGDENKRYERHDSMVLIIARAISPALLTAISR